MGTVAGGGAASAAAREREDKLLYVVTHLLHHIYRVDIVDASLTPRSAHAGPPSSARPAAAHPGRSGAAGGMPSLPAPA